MLTPASADCDHSRRAAWRHPWSSRTHAVLLSGIDTVFLILFSHVGTLRLFRLNFVFHAVLMLCWLLKYRQKFWLQPWVTTITTGMCQSSQFSHHHPPLLRPMWTVANNHMMWIWYDTFGTNVCCTPDVRPVKRVNSVSDVSQFAQGRSDVTPAAGALLCPVQLGAQTHVFFQTTVERWLYLYCLPMNLREKQKSRPESNTRLIAGLDIFACLDQKDPEISQTANNF